MECSLQEGHVEADQGDLGEAEESPAQSSTAILTYRPAAPL